jgi:hypothetical protein
VAGLRGRINKLEQMVRGDEFSYELPTGEVRSHRREECVETYTSMIARIRASERGEELLEPTPLELSHLHGTPLDRECPELDRFMPRNLYNDVEG